MGIRSIEEAKSIVVECIKTPVERKALIAKCVKNLNLPDEILKDKRPGGDLNKFKCLFGLAVTELINSGVLAQEDNILRFKNEDRSDVKKVEEVKRDIKIETILFDILKKGEIDRNNLLDATVRIYNETQEREKESTIRADAGRLLSFAVKNSRVVKNAGVYSLYKEPTSESAEAKNKRLFAELEDEELVNQTILMLEQWYEKVGGYSDLESANIDGPEDGGIDGIIKGKDKMGIAEKIIIQVKKINKNGKHVPLSEIREFYGVFATENDATKALFVTNSKYHKETKNFAGKTKYFILIDGDRWLELAKQCGFELQDRQEDQSA